MTAPYKKRLKGNWTQGKAYKGDSEERLYAKEEIAQALKEMDEAYQASYKKSKRQRNERARLEHRIKWCEQRLETYKERGPSFSSYLSDWIREDLVKARKKLAKLLEKAPAK